jgi:hypothetical protein
MSNAIFIDPAARWHKAADAPAKSSAVRKLAWTAVAFVVGVGLFVGVAVTAGGLAFYAFATETSLGSVAVAKPLPSATRQLATTISIPPAPTVAAAVPSASAPALAAPRPSRAKAKTVAVAERQPKPAEPVQAQDAPPIDASDLPPSESALAPSPVGRVSSLDVAPAETRTVDSASLGAPVSLLPR